MSSNRHPFDGPEVFDDTPALTLEEAAAFRAADPWPHVTQALEVLQARRAS